MMLEVASVGPGDDAVYPRSHGSLPAPPCTPPGCIEGLWLLGGTRSSSTESRSRSVSVLHDRCVSLLFVCVWAMVQVQFMYHVVQYREQIFKFSLASFGLVCLRQTEHLTRQMLL